MLFDAQWVDEIYANPELALADLALTAEEKDWLHAPDRRRWGADPDRPLRALQTLLDEYPVAFAQGVSEHGFPALEQFFRGSDFRQCIEHGGSLALSFGDFLVGLSPSLASVAKLERAMAQIRRSRPVPERHGGSIQRWQTHPHVLPLILPETTLSLWTRQHHWLRTYEGALVDAVLSPTYPATDFPTDAPVTGLLVTAEDGVSAGECSIELARFLIALHSPLGRPAVDGHLQALGAEPGEAGEILDGLVEDRLVLCLPGGRG